jgi:cytochrome P450 family 142 subfamily A polypeptide 1
MPGVTNERKRTMTTLLTTPTINLLDPEFYVDPWESYRWLRDHSPVHWDPVQRIWGISRHADVQDIERDTQLYSSFPGSRPKIDQSDDQSMINLDNPEHQQQRKHVISRFTPRTVRDHEAEVRALSDRIIDEATRDGAGTCEVVEQIASRLPAMEITALLGYAPEQWELIRELSEVTMYHAGQTSADGSEPPRYTATADVTMRWAAATMEIIAARRAQPEHDLISIWAHAEVDGKPWDDKRILEETILLVDGGAETTRTVISAIVRELALRPDVQRQLREQPELLTTGVEEFVRWVSPILNMRRTVTRDHVLHGQQLRKGDEVLLMYASANRDERAIDRPDEFDITRPTNHHVAFGLGTHLCLGANLARLELRVLFEQLLARLPEWHLTPGTEPRILPATFTRADDSVHIDFDPALVRAAG